MRGFGSVIGIVVAMFFTAVLILLYLRISMPSVGGVKQQTGAIDRARDTARAVEEQQNRHQQELRQQLGE